MHYLKTKYYFINKFDTKNISKLNKDTTVIYRNYKPNKDYEKIILKIKSYCKKKRIKFYLSNDVKLANKLKLDIPKPLAQGTPSDDYPWDWSIYEWIDGKTVYETKHKNKQLFAKD